MSLGFQGPFSLQCNPDAARAGALWQKFVRRAAKIRLGDERAVVDVLATFVDGRLGSCGEISEWIDGRNWQFEVDDHPGSHYYVVSARSDCAGAFLIVGSPGTSRLNQPLPVGWAPYQERPDGRIEAPLCQ